MISNKIYKLNLKEDQFIMFNNYLYRLPQALHIL